MRIAVDIMGGDKGPEPLIKGCINYIRNNTGSDLVIVGDEKIISKVLAEERFSSHQIEIAHTTQFVNMDDRISKVLRRKKLASISIASRLVKSGYCDGLYTIGNTAAAISWSNIVLRKIKGVKRSALCSALPYPGGFTILIDSGANIRCTGESLLQFAEMGEIVARYFLQKDKPRIGLINIGEEEGKGKLKTQRAHYLLRKSGLNYYGYIEGNDLPEGKVDVAVCDGFMGNVLLKYTEGLLKILGKTGMGKDIKQVFKKIIGLPVKNINRLNGAPLLGVNGIVMVGHGSSNEIDFENGLSLTKLFIQSGIFQELNNRFAKKRGTFNKEERQ